MSRWNKSKSKSNKAAMSQWNKSKSKSNKAAMSQWNKFKSKSKSESNKQCFCFPSYVRTPAHVNIFVWLAFKKAGRAPGLKNSVNIIVFVRPAYLSGRATGLKNSVNIIVFVGPAFCWSFVSLSSYCCQSCVNCLPEQAYTSKRVF